MTIVQNTLTPLDASPQARTLEEQAPSISWSPAAPPWRPAWQPAASKLMLRTPGVRQDEQRAQRWPFGAWPDLLLLSACQCGENLTSTRGPCNNPKLIAISPAGFPNTHCSSSGLSRVPHKNGIYQAIFHQGRRSTGIGHMLHSNII
eukprot:143681-Pelagomonas_calceolata.AAC.4